MTAKTQCGGGGLPHTGTFSWHFLPLLGQTEGERPRPRLLRAMAPDSVSIKKERVFLSPRTWAHLWLTSPQVAECQLRAQACVPPAQSPAPAGQPGAGGRARPAHRSRPSSEGATGSSEISKASACPAAAAGGPGGGRPSQAEPSLTANRRRAAV